MQNNQLSDPTVHVLYEPTVAEIQQGMDQGAFSLTYQPYFGHEMDELLGIETFIRWRHQGLGVILPAVRFIAAAQQDAELALAMDSMVLHAAAGQAKEFGRIWGKKLPLAVNCMTWNREEVFLAMLEQVRKRYADGFSALELDCTEAIFSADSAAVSRNMVALARKGIAMGMDNCSLTSDLIPKIKGLPLRSLKINLTHFTRSDKVTETKKLVKQLRRSHSLNLVAVGVEDSEDLEYLREVGFNAFQGAIFKCPLSAEDVIRFLQFMQQAHDAY
ncbi:MAG: EAL domain-containing protein [Nitrospirae bacterium]|nr:EAL domain-containing protein [Magnetococcales bacterium]HAT49326.1 hypothetical protein [Alphaproteobacteria bacterium]